MKHTFKLIDGRWQWDPPFTPEEKAKSQERFREMLAAGQGPVVVTDNTFWAGRWEDQARLGALHAEEAKAAGVSTTGKTYVSGLAEFPGDPKAWVDGRGDLKRICEERGWGCQGAVNVTPADTAPPAAVAVAPDIIENEVQTILAAHPEPAAVNVGELREQVTELRKPHWAK